MTPWAILFWKSLALIWFLMIPVFIWWLYRLRWKWSRRRLYVLAAWIATSFVLHIYMIPSSPVAPQENPTLYKSLLENLNEYYIEHGYSSDELLLHTHGNSSLSVNHPIRRNMEALEVSCLIFVNRVEGDIGQGLIVAGKGTPTFGDSIIKSYKIVDGSFANWPDEYRLGGPYLDQWRKSFLRGGGMYCNSSG